MPVSLVSQLAHDLHALGVVAGDILLVHSSLRSLGPPTPDPEVVIQGLLAALGAEGTLLMPALSYRQVSPAQPLFHVQQTPSHVGGLPEYFRTRPGTRRSVHPTHSVSGVGEAADRLLEQHERDRTPAGAYSPFRRLPAHKGKILMLGCGLGPNTSLHAVEELSEPPYLFGVPYPIAIQGNGPDYVTAYTPHDFGGYRQRYDRIASLLDSSCLRRGPVGAAEAWLIDAAAMWEVAQRALAGDPWFFVEALPGGA